MSSTMQILTMHLLSADRSHPSDRPSFRASARRISRINHTSTVRMERGRAERSWPHYPLSERTIQIAKSSRARGQSGLIRRIL